MSWKGCSVYVRMDLRALLLGLHHGVRGQVRDAHGRVGRVDALAAGARGVERVDAQIGFLDVQLDFAADVGDDVHGGEGRVPPA